MTIPWSRANRIAEVTSSTAAHRAMSAGRRSIIPFHTSRAVS
jgi:endonuclease/exonuclease/phosphatase (EEP) superfamily protein YafD